MKPAWSKLLNIFILICFALNSFLPSASAQLLPTANPTSLMTLQAVPIQGIMIYPNDPLKIDFIIKNENNISDADFKNETEKAVKYFFAALTIPEKDMWVNLSPYEKDRIVGEGLNKTDLGKELLEQDFQLKQLTASLMNPEKDLGDQFWKEIQTKLNERLGNNAEAINLLNKVWIVPDQAEIMVIGQHVFISQSHLKVLHEADYLALENSLGSVPNDSNSDIYRQAINDILVPAIEKEVNEGPTFAKLRQIYSATILAAWYKKNLKDSLIGQVYANQNKLKGIETDDQGFDQKVFDKYVMAYKQGAFEFVKEDYDPQSQDMSSKKYISGGILMDADKAMLNTNNNITRREFIKRGREFVRRLGVAVIVSVIGKCMGACATIADVAGKGDEYRLGEFLKSIDVKKTTALNNLTFNKNLGAKSFTANNSPYLAIGISEGLTSSIQIYNVSDPQNIGGPVVTIPNITKPENFFIDVEGSNLRVTVENVNNEIARFNVDIDRQTVTQTAEISKETIEALAFSHIKEIQAITPEITAVFKADTSVVNTSEGPIYSAIVRYATGDLKTFVDAHLVASYDTNGNLLYNKIIPNIYASVPQEKPILASLVSSFVREQKLYSLIMYIQDQNYYYVMVKHDLENGEDSFVSEPHLTHIDIDQYSLFVSRDESYVLLYNNEAEFDHLRKLNPNTGEERALSFNSVINTTILDLEKETVVVTNSGDTIEIFLPNRDNVELKLQIQAPDFDRNFFKSVSFNEAEQSFSINTPIGLYTVYVKDVEKLLRLVDDVQGNKPAYVPWDQLVDFAVLASPGKLPVQVTDETTYGGIDLNTQNLNIHKTGDKVKFSIPANMPQINPAQIEGFTPTIINLVPFNPAPLMSSLPEEYPVKTLSKI